MLSSLALSLWQSFYNQWVSSHHHCYPSLTSSSSSSTLFSVLITSNSPASQKFQSQIGSEICWNAFLFLRARASQRCLHWKGDLLQKLPKFRSLFLSPAKANWLNAQTWTHPQKPWFWWVPLPPTLGNNKLEAFTTSSGLYDSKNKVPLLTTPTTEQ